LKIVVDDLVVAVPAAPWIGPEDYVDDIVLPHIIVLLEENTRRAAEKAEEWKREAMLQEEIYVDLADSDEDL
jgi:hypothetical protein